MSQSIALNGMFTNLATKACVQNYLPQFDAYMRLALRAQNQCRTTLETLAKVKNPVIFAKQANIAHGPQQVNNTLNTGARETDSPPNEQIGGTSWQTRMDGRRNGASDSAGQSGAGSRGDGRQGQGHHRQGHNKP